MRIGGQAYRTICVADDAGTVSVIDQTRLPFEFERGALRSMDDCRAAIRDMLVRGAPLIGATAAYGVALAMRDDASDAGLARAVERCRRPGRRPSTCAGRSSACAPRAAP